MRDDVAPLLVELQPRRRDRDADGPHFDAPVGRVEVADRVIGRPGLTPRMRLASFAVAEALFTTEEGPPPQERLQWLVDDLDDFFVQAGDRARLAYRLCLLGISILAPLLVFRLPPFRNLSREKRTHALERLEQSPFALAVFGAKAILCFIYYEHPAARRLIGHDGECLTSAKRTLR
jgi:hypothetical protein